MVTREGVEDILASPLDAVVFEVGTGQEGQLALGLDVELRIGADINFVGSSGDADAYLAPGFFEGRQAVFQCFDDEESGGVGEEPGGRASP